ncbi:MAG: DUF542 domain-containing protein, partial [Nitrospirae bacterium]|nr:DUF542 domain-containing protein [Fimbriimonadaceae bacterium]
MNTPTLDRPVGQLVAEKPSRARVFERWGIDYCCGGKKTLGQVCTTKNLDAQAVVQELVASDAGPQPETIDWNAESLMALCDHIQEVHHGYLRLALPRLSMLTEKVASRHGDRDPRLVELRGVFMAFRAEMEEHTTKEDRILFPAIRSLEAESGPDDLARNIQHPIRVMLEDHDSAGEALEQMKSLTEGFVPDANACNTHRAMLDALA